MKKLFSTALACAALWSTGAQADLIFGVYIGANTWQHEADGDIKNGDSVVDVVDDLGFGSSENNNMLYIAIEHPVPLLPNIKIQHTELEFSGAQTLDTGFDFDDFDYASGTSISTDVDLTHADATVYYEILDNWISLDLGLTLRAFDAQVAINDGTQRNEMGIKGVLPLLYGKAKFDLPFTGFAIGAEANTISFSGDKAFDASFSVSYENSLGFGAEIGYRTITLELDQFDDLDTDLSIDGPYAGLNFHF